MSIDVILNSPVVQALGLALFHSMWQAVVVFCLIQILLFWVKQPANRYRIQYGGLCIIFIAFSVTFFEQLSVADTSTNMLAAAPVLDDNLRLQSPLQQASSPWWQPLVSMHHSPMFLRALPFITIGYGLGILLLTFRTMLSFDRIFKLRKKLLPVSASLQHEVFHLRNLLRIKREVAIYLSHTINVPVMLGYLKPIIVLPVALINQLDKQQVEAILLHELAHIHRQDYLFNVLQIVMETLLFFNPIVWWLSAAIRKERELACDDYALKYIGTPLKYAQALFALEEARIHNMVAAMAATGNSKKHLLFNRIKRITDMKNNTRKNPQGIAVALTALMITVAMVGFFVAGAQDVPKDKQEHESKTSSYRKSTVIVKDEDGKIHRYEDESSSDEDATQALEEAMKAAQTALAEIDEDQIESYTKAAIDAFNSEEIKAAMSEAGKQMAKVDWNEVSKSIEEGMGAVNEIDWDEIGKDIDKELKSIKDIGLDNEEVRKAMKEAGSAIEEARKASSKAMLDSKEAAKHLSAAKLQRDYAALAMGASVIESDKQRREHLKEVDSKRSEIIERRRLSKEHEASVLNAAQSGRDDMNQFLAELKARNLVEDVDNVKVKMTNDALYLNGKKQSQATFDAMKKYAPQGESSTLTIKRSTKSS